MADLGFHKKQSIKIPISESNRLGALSKHFDTAEKNKYTTEDALQIANKVTGGLMSQLLANPSWEDKVLKAGLGFMYSLNTPSDKTSVMLMFQYNPQILVEKHQVSYAYRQSYRGEPIITEFKNVEPEIVYVEFMLDAYSDYAGLEEYFKTLLAGTTQSALLLAGMGSTGFSDLFHLMQISESQTKPISGMNSDTRTLKPAIDNLKKFVKNTEYTLTQQENSEVLYIEQATYQLGKVTTMSYLSDPPLCVLNWGTYRDFKCIIKDMSFEHQLFNPRTLEPIRTKVSLELEEYYNPFIDALKKSFDGQIISN